MFREMRRKNQALKKEICLDILNRRENGTLALLGDHGYPYAVPLNYVCMGEKLYFHCAVEGHKIDSIRRCEKASYCVIDADRVDTAEYTTRFRSVIAFGKVRLLEDESEKIAALNAIGNRFCPETPEKTGEEIRGAVGHTAVIEFTIDHISGKESQSLARERREGNK